MRTSPAQRRGGIAGIGALALLGCLLLGRDSPQTWLLSYLAAWLFFLGPVLGSVPMLMITPLTGGRWGEALRPALLAATRVLPLMALLMLPLLIGMGSLYPWMHPASMHDPDFSRQQWYLDAPFFIGRALACMALWLGLAFSIQRRLDDPARQLMTVRFAAITVIVYALTITVAAVDWVGSLVPAWHSSTLGLIVGTSQLVAAAALAVFFVTGTRLATPSCLRDLGSLLLMLVLAWSYLVFMDFLTAWIADLPAETVWYLPRQNSSWHWLALVLAMFHLAVPFAVLLSRQAKQHRLWMHAVAGMLLLAQAAFAIWLVWPNFRPRGFALGWSDLLAWIGVGGLCWALFDYRLMERDRHDGEAP